jgi:L-alanine-DL-glutamate epimerase-like enolase superfamily enzyme
MLDADDRIASVSVRACRLPPAVPWEDATHRVGALEFIFVDLRSTDGVTGTGMSFTVGVGASASVALIEDYIVGTLIGQPTDAQAIDSLLRHHLARTGNGAISRLAICAVETAAWDLEARRQGRSVAAVLGATRSQIDAYASSIDLLLTADELADDVQSRVDRGYRGVKIKVGRPTLGEDVARVAAAREAVGDGVALYLDANQAWDVDEAISRVLAFKPFAPGWIEEPLNPADIAGHARIRNRTGIPVAVGESLYSLAEFERYVAAEAVDVLQPDVGRVGGFAEWMRIARLAADNRKSISAHYLAELSVHAMCAIPNALLLEDVSGGSLHELGLSTLPLVVGGSASVDRVSGLRLALDDAAIERHRLDPARLRHENTLSAKQAT